MAIVLTWNVWFEKDVASEFSLDFFDRIRVTPVEGGPNLGTELETIPNDGIVQEGDTFGVRKISGHSHNESQQFISFPYDVTYVVLEGQSTVNRDAQIIYFAKVTKGGAIDRVVKNKWLSPTGEANWRTFAYIQVELVAVTPFGEADEVQLKNGTVIKTRDFTEDFRIVCKEEDITFQGVREIVYEDEE